MSNYFKIEEIAGAYYFTHEGIYTTPEAAEKAALRVKNGNLRVVEYARGGWCGPERVRIVSSINTRGSSGDGAEIVRRHEEVDTTEEETRLSPNASSP